MEKVPLVSTVIVSIDGEERCTAREEIEPIGDLFWCEDSEDQLDVEQVKIRIRCVTGDPLFRSSHGQPRMDWKIVSPQEERRSSISVGSETV
eukprot:1411425-Amphidinium_carterae.1